MTWLQRRVLFFGGKGGVGKTTLAAAVALRLAATGQRTLLVSTDSAHSTGDILEADLGPEPRPIQAGCWAMEVDPEQETDRYIEDVKRRIAETTSPRLVQEVERQIDIARVSPGAEEAAVFERFTRIIEDAARDYDRIVFDTAPTGQTLRLLSLPELMTTWIGGLIGQRKKANILGRMWRNVAGAAAGDRPDRDDPVLAMLEERRARFHRTRQTLTDARLTAFVFVLVPERLPILETEKAVTALARYGIPVGGIIVNRVLPEEADGRFLGRRREREAEYLARISRAFEAYPRHHVPLFESDVIGVLALGRLAETVLDGSAV